MATPIEDIQRQLTDLERQLVDLRRESTINVGLLATAIRSARLGLADLEQSQAVRRLNQPTEPDLWDPRSGQFGQVDLAQSLVDRLKSGVATAAATGSAAPQDTVSLSEITDSVAEWLATAIGNARIEWGSGSAARDLRLARTAAKSLELDDTAGGPVALLVAGDLVQELGSAMALSYNGDGTLASVTRSGAQGAATSTVTYAGGQVTSIVTVRGGKTVTVTPTYTGARITGLSRSVA